MRDPEKKSDSVLVVEDEHLIRMDTVSSLEAQGFIVTKRETPLRPFVASNFTMRSD
jgi:CheY-like chemotaxis protein